jgi:Tfp pilus assembly protein FimT
MTLLEIMVVMLIAGMMMSSAVMGFGAVRRGRLRAGAAHLASAFRFAYVHALSTGRPTRVVLPLNDNRVWIEDTEEAHVLDPRDPLRLGGAAPGEEAMAAEEAARQQATRISELRPRTPRAEFTRPTGARFRERTLEDGVVVTRVYAQHEEQARTEGSGYIYFFPGGVCERAVVHLRGADGVIFSVTLNGLSGRTQIIDHAVEPPAATDAREEDDRNEVDLRNQRLQEVTP